MSVPSDDITKLTVKLPTGTYDKLKEIADKLNMSVTQALRQVIVNQAYLYEEMGKGAKILLENDQDRIRQLVFSEAAPLMARTESRKASSRPG